MGGGGGCNGVHTVCNFQFKLDWRLVIRLVNIDKVGPREKPKRVQPLTETRPRKVLGTCDNMTQCDLVICVTSTSSTEFLILI